MLLYMYGVYRGKNILCPSLIIEESPRQITLKLVQRLRRKSATDRQRYTSKLIRNHIQNNCDEKEQGFSQFKFYFAIDVFLRNFFPKAAFPKSVGSGAATGAERAEEREH